MQERFEELARLQDGWLDGTGFRITEAALAAAKVLAEERKPVRVYPTEGGGILVENNTDSWEIDPNGTIERF
jgi:hypothetical protein